MQCPCKYHGIAALLLACSMLIPAAGLAAELAATVDDARSCGVSDELIYHVESGAGRGEFSPEDGAAMLTALTRACAEALPLAPFEEKLAEGLAKQVSPPRINQALERILAQYALARELVSESAAAASPQLEAVVGSGLAAGVPREVFESYFTAHAGLEPEPLLVGAEMTSLLHQAGVAPDLARSVVDAGAASGRLAPQWRFVVQVFLLARQRGVGDADVAAAASEVISGGGELSDVAARLGFTLRSMSGKGPGK